MLDLDAFAAERGWIAALYEDQVDCQMIYTVELSAQNFLNVVCLALVVAVLNGHVVGEAVKADLFDAIQLQLLVM